MMVERLFRIKATSAFFALLSSVFFIFPHQFPLPVRLFNQASRPWKNIITAISQYDMEVYRLQKS
jgi:hypothetical protein